MPIFQPQYQQPYPQMPTADTNPRPPQMVGPPMRPPSGGDTGPVGPPRPPIPGGGADQMATGWQGIGNILNRMDPAQAQMYREQMMAQTGQGGNRYNFMRDLLNKVGAPGASYLPQQGAGAFDWHGWNASLQGGTPQQPPLGGGGMGPDGGPEPTPGLWSGQPYKPKFGSGEGYPPMPGPTGPPGQTQSRGVPPIPQQPPRPQKVYKGRHRGFGHQKRAQGWYASLSEEERARREGRTPGAPGPQPVVPNETGQVPPRRPIPGGGRRGKVSPYY